MADAPWDGATAHSRAGPAFRDAVFGGGDGIFEFHLDEDAQVIRIRVIVWSRG